MRMPFSSAYVQPRAPGPRPWLDSRPSARCVRVPAAAVLPRPCRGSSLGPCTFRARSNPSRRRRHPAIPAHEPLPAFRSRLAPRRMPAPSHRPEPRLKRFNLSPVHRPLCHWRARRLMLVSPSPLMQPRPRMCPFLPRWLSPLVSFDADQDVIRARFLARLLVFALCCFLSYPQRVVVPKLSEVGFVCHAPSWIHPGHSS
jgi:hypothetical protein